MVGAHTLPLAGSASFTLLHRQGDGSYLAVRESTAVALTPGSGNTATTAPFTIPAGLVSGIYRIRIEYDGASYDYAMIIGE